MIHRRTEMSKFLDPCSSLLVFSRHGWQLNMLKQCPVWGLQLFLEVCLVSGAPDVIKLYPFQRPFPLPFILPLEHRPDTLFIAFSLHFFCICNRFKNLFFPFCERQLCFHIPSNVSNSSLHFDYDNGGNESDWSTSVATVGQWSSPSNRCINLKYKHNNSSRRTFCLSLSKQNMSLNPGKKKKKKRIMTVTNTENQSDNLRKAWSIPNP